MTLGHNHADITGIVVRKLAEDIKLRMRDNRGYVIRKNKAKEAGQGGSLSCSQRIQF